MVYQESGQKQRQREPNMAVWQLWWFSVCHVWHTSWQWPLVVAWPHDTAVDKLFWDKFKATQANELFTQPD